MNRIAYTRSALVGIALSGLLTIGLLAGCGEQAPPTAVDRLAALAEAAAKDAAEQTTDPHEIKMIESFYSPPARGGVSL